MARQPLAPVQPPAAASDPSVPLPTGGGQPMGSAPVTGDGLTPPGGFSQPFGSQGNPSGGGQPNNGRHGRPSN